MYRIFVKSVSLLIVLKSGAFVVYDNVPESDVERIASSYPSMSHYFTSKNYGMEVDGK